MALFRFHGPETEPRIPVGEDLFLRRPLMEDYVAWAELRTVSRPHLAPWEPLWPADDLAKSAFRRRLKRYDEDSRADLAYPFFLFARDPDRPGDAAADTLLGGLTLGLVRRGAAQAATLGYWMGAPHAGRGFMSRAVPALLVHAAQDLGLKRIEAACMPENTASLRVLEKAGFRREGYARDYLCIAGAWRDHILFGILAREIFAQLAARQAGAGGAFGLPRPAGVDTKA